MRSRVGLAFVVIALVATLISCRGSAGKSANHYTKAFLSFNPQIIETMNIPSELDLSVLSYGQGYRIIVDKDSPLLLNNFSLSDGVTIAPGYNKVDAKTSKALDTNGWLAPVCDNLLAASDSDGNLKLIVQSMTTEEEIDSMQMLIAKFPKTDQLAIKPEDAPVGGSQLIEKYYRINLNDEAWNHLDKSEIAFVNYGPFGAEQLKVFLPNQKELEFSSIFDFSNNQFVGIYQNRLGAPARPVGVSLTSPIHLAESIPTILPQETCVICIPKSSQEQQVVLSYEGTLEKYSIYDEQFIRKLNPRYRDGINLGYVAIPYFQGSQNRVVIHVDPIKEDLYLTLMLEQIPTTFTATLEPYEGGFNTNVLTMSKLTELTVSSEDFQDGVFIQPIILNEKNAPILEIDADNVSASIVYDYQGGSGLIGPTMKLLQPDNKTHISVLYLLSNSQSCHFSLHRIASVIDDSCVDIVWNETRRTLECVNCPIHRDIPYNYYNAIVFQKDTYLKGKYSTKESYPGYGKIQLIDGNGKATEFKYDNSSFGSNGVDPLGFYGWKGSDPDRFFDIRILRILKVGDKKEITVRLSLGGVGDNIITTLYKQ